MPHSELKICIEREDGHWPGLGVQARGRDRCGEGGQGQQGMERGGE